MNKQELLNRLMSKNEQVIDKEEECTHEFVSYDVTYYSHCAACGKYLGDEYNDGDIIEIISKEETIGDE